MARRCAAPEARPERAASGESPSEEPAHLRFPLSPQALPGCLIWAGLPTRQVPGAGRCPGPPLLWASAALPAVPWPIRCRLYVQASPVRHLRPALLGRLSWKGGCRDFCHRGGVSPCPLRDLQTWQRSWSPDPPEGQPESGHVTGPACWPSGGSRGTRDCPSPGAYLEPRLSPTAQPWGLPLPRLGVPCSPAHCPTSGPPNQTAPPDRTCFPNLPVKAGAVRGTAQPLMWQTQGPSGAARPT